MTRLNPIRRTVALILLALCSRATALDRPIRDLTDIEHDRDNVVTGLGLVTGLNGTGGEIAPTREFFVSLMARFGRPIDPIVRAALRNDNRLTTDSMSVVLVTAQLNSNRQDGSKIPVLVSALDGATDLNNGVLAATPLLGMDKEVYAVASGRVMTGGLVALGAGATVTKNHPTTGSAFANVVAPVPFCTTDQGFFRLLLRNPSHVTATRIQDAINRQFAYAAVVDTPGIVRVLIPPRFNEEQFRFISLVQQIRVHPSIEARVVINSQTGTVVATEKVTISQASVLHGNISVVTGESPLVSQPLPQSRGETVVVPRTEIDIVEERNPMTVIGETTTVTELAETLNTLGVSPQDLAGIFLQLDRAGVLHARLEIN